MPNQVTIVLILTFIIYVVGTFAYSVRLVGVKTGRIAIAFAVFNIFALVSRTANSFQSPLLAKTIENNIHSGSSLNMLNVFRLILVSATLATVCGALLIPTFMKIFTKIVLSFSVYKSIPKVIFHGFSKSGIEHFRQSLTIPNKKNISHFKHFRKLPKKVIILNMLATSISTVGVLASLYAGYLNPELRSTCNNLSPVINMFSTILLFIFIDPHISMLADEIIRGECSQSYYTRCIVFIVGGLILGTLLAQVILVPAANLIIFVAKLI